MVDVTTIVMASYFTTALGYNDRTGTQGAQLPAIIVLDSLEENEHAVVREFGIHQRSSQANQKHGES